MSETTRTKNKDGSYTIDYINGEWATFYNVKPEDAFKDVEYLYTHYEVY